METQTAINLFLNDCRDRGLSQSTIGSRASHLKHFQLTYPELPTELAPVDRFLTRVIRGKRGRYNVRKSLLAFYSYLEKQNIAVNPIPPGKVGRPKKEIVPNSCGLFGDKLGRGGQTTPTESSSTCLYTGQVIDDLLASKGDKSPQTIRWYHTYVDRFSEAFPDLLPLEPEPIEKFIYSLKRSPRFHQGVYDTDEITPESRHGCFQVLKSLYLFLEKRHRLPVDPQWGVINPIRQINAPRVPRKVPASLDMNEVQTVINACQTSQEQALIALLVADSGPRAGEVVSLTREDISTDFLRVRGKTGERQISVTPQMRGMLLSLVPSGPLFINCYGKPYTTAGIYGVVQRVLQRAGIKKRHMGPHMLRHTFGRQHMAQGGDLVTLQELLGHTNIETTRKYAFMAQEEIHKRHEDTGLLRQLTLNFNGNHHDQDEVSHEPANQS